MRLQNGVGQIHNIVHPNPTQKNPQSLKHLQNPISSQILEELFHSNSLHKNHHLLFVLLHLDQPGLSPPEFLQKAGSGVVVLQNGVGQIHTIVHPNPTQNTHNLWNIFKIQFLPRFWKSCFIQILHIRIIISACFASPWPTGFEPTGVLTKSRFRSSGVTEWCWTNSQYSPSKSHPKNLQSLKHLQKLSETQILEELFYSNSSHKNHHFCLFCFTLTNRVWAHRSSCKKQVPE